MTDRRSWSFVEALLLLISVAILGAIAYLTITGRWPSPPPMPF